MLTANKHMARCHSNQQATLQYISEMKHNENYKAVDIIHLHKNGLLPKTLKMELREKRNLIELWWETEQG